MSPCVSLQIECVVESFPTESAEISLGVTVTLHVSVEKPLQGETFPANPAGKLAGVGFTSHGWQLLHFLLLRCVAHHGILDTVASVDNL